MGDQSSAPYLDALVEYADRNPGRFHVPGHKGRWVDPGLRDALGERAILMDIPAGMRGIDMAPDPTTTPFQISQRLAAEAFGARRSWFLVNGGSSGNHAICLALAHMGERVVVQRNVHNSTVDGLVLSGLRPRFVSPELDDELGIAHCLKPEALDEALASEPEAVAAMVVSPTYFGAVADVASLAEVAHGRGVPLVVDEAWGSHMHFSDELPDAALTCGADMVLSSTHKIVGSMTQSAILHIGAGERIDEAIVDRAVTLIESTSPNALISCSLDAARRQAATNGQALLARTIAGMAKLRDQVRGIPGLSVFDESIIEHASVHAFDPLRLTIDVRGTGVSGHRLADLMSELADIDVELHSDTVLVAVFGLAEPTGESGQRLVGALERAVEAIGRDGEEPVGPFVPPPPWGSPELSLREAFLAPQEIVPFAEAEGRIAAESLATYPPGVPNVLPGERLNAETLDYVTKIVAHGGQVRGASDRDLRTIRVVIERG